MGGILGMLGQFLPPGTNFSQLLQSPGFAQMLGGQPSMTGMNNSQPTGMPSQLNPYGVGGNIPNANFMTPFSLPQGMGQQPMGQQPSATPNNSRLGK